MMDCSAHGCSRPHHAHGLCQGHLYRVRKFGSVGSEPIAQKTPNGELIAFLHAHVDHIGEECLIWPFAKSENGYGVVRFLGKHMSASRAMCIIAHGSPPTPDHEAAHSCGRGHAGCVNQAHLRWATAIENQHDRIEHGTDTRGERHHAAVLSEAIVLGLRDRCSRLRRPPYKAIADELGIDPATVRRAVLGITWSHI